MKTNGSTDLTRASVGQRLTSLSRFRTYAIFLVVLVILLVGPSIAISSTIPTISITSVSVNNSVTIQTHNYPAGQTFVVTMGPYGSYGIGGIKVGTLNSGAGGSMAATYPIPAAYHGADRVAIRLESPQGYYSFNWFWNNTTGTGTGGIPGTPGYTGIPTIGIASVIQDNKVVVKTHNFPAGQVFKWTMGPMGTQGINGIPVAGFEVWDSGVGGEQQLELPIPAALYGSYQISIRAQTGHPWPHPYYAYNWFYNNTTGGMGSPGPTPVPPSTGYTGYPTFKVCKVEQNNNIMIRITNLPPNQVFRVTMGPMWTAGVNGIPVAGYEAWNSGAGGNQDLTLPIPAQLYGSYQISVRMQTGHAYPYYAYNWFYNNTASVC